LKSHIYPLLALLVLAGLTFSCSRPTAPSEDTQDEPRVVIKRRSDGTISSVNQVNDYDQIHGTRVSYYRDGKTVYSKQSVQDGKKHGPSVWYYENGNIFEEASFENGKRHGPHRKYHKTGELLAEYVYENGHPLPGLKEYLKDGTLVSDYPEVQFREIDHLAERNRIDLEIYCTRSKGKMKYHRATLVNGQEERVYLITEKGKALLQFYVQPGASLDETVDIIAEIPTELGNLWVLEKSYRLQATN
jgi:antitoxin component YwqK of YwqJK toxin-antitoxin module